MSEVQFNGLKGNFNFYRKEDSKPVVEEQNQQLAPAADKKEVPADKVLDAMEFLGQQNLAYVSGKINVDPAKYLDEARISSIQDSMAAFEKGVEKYAGAIKAEFGNVLSDDTVLALAANSFALE